MAQKGTYSAYQQTTPTQLNFGEEAKRVEAAESGIRDAEALRLKEEKEARLAQKQRVAENFGKDYSEIVDVITGMESIDQAFAAGVSSASDMVLSIYKDIEKNPSLLNDLDTSIKRENLKKYSKNLAEASKLHTEYVTKVATGLEDGTLSSWNKGVLNEAESVYEKSHVVVGVDRLGRPTAATLKLDDNGDPVLDEDGEPIVQDLRVAEALRKGGFPPTVPMFKLTEEARKIGQALGDNTVKRPDGSFIDIKTQTFESVEKGVRGLVKAYLGTAEKPSNEAKSIWADTMGGEYKEAFTADDMKAIEDTYVDAIRPYYKEVNETDVDRTAINQAATRADKKAEKAAEGTTSSKFTLITDQDKKPKRDEFYGIEGDIKGKALSFSLPTNAKTKESTVEVMGPNGKPLIVDKVYLLDSGELAYGAFELKGRTTMKINDIDTDEEGSTSSNVYGKRVGGGMDTNDNVLTAVAKAYGLDNEGELKELLTKEYKNFGSPKTEEAPKKETSEKKFEDMTKEEKKAYMANKYK